jgi:hypothetical protein
MANQGGRGVGHYGLLKYCRAHKGKVHFVVVFNLTRFAREKYDPSRSGHI